MLLRENFCLRTNFALEIGVLQFFEVPPGGSVVSPFFFPFFPLFFCFLFLLLWLGRIFFAFFSHFFRIFFACFSQFFLHFFLWFVFFWHFFCIFFVICFFFAFFLLFFLHFFAFFSAQKSCHGVTPLRRGSHTSLPACHAEFWQPALDQLELTFLPWGLCSKKLLTQLRAS